MHQGSTFVLILDAEKGRIGEGRQHVLVRLTLSYVCEVWGEGVPSGLLKDISLAEMEVRQKRLSNLSKQFPDV